MFFYSYNLYENVMHKVLMEVDEKGAKSETTERYEYETEPNDAYIVEPQEVFNANHPFLYLIRDNVNDAIISMGAVSEFSYNGDSHLLTRSQMNKDNRNCYQINAGRQHLMPIFNLLVWLTVNVVIFFC